MKICHFDCFSGISGDMVLGALVDAGVPGDVIVDAINSLNLPITVEIEKVKRCGFAATKVNIIAQDEESYRFLPDVYAILDIAEVSPSAREMAKRIFHRLAEAEAASHGMPIEKVHFHEVGALDSIADILGTAVGLDWLKIDRFTSSPVPTGTGTVKGAHGIMPIPAPGTAALLKGVPIAASEVKFELTTPTGAAILATLVKEFTSSPAFVIQQIGSGAGKMDFIDRPNILRLFIGETVQRPNGLDFVVVLETNLDDTTPEIIGYTVERLLQAGALDVYTQAIQMKKQRPAVMLCVIAHPSQAGELEAIIFSETGTFGIRKSTAERTILQRTFTTVLTKLGAVRVKQGLHQSGLSIATPEYEDCAALARQHQVPLREVFEAVRRASEESGEAQAN